MNIGDVTETVVDEATSGGGAGTVTELGRSAAQSGALAGVAGGLLLLRGARAFRGGRRLRGIVQVLAGAGLVAVAVRQRRRDQVDQTDVVDTAPNIEEVADEPDAGESHAGGDAAEEVVDTGTDVEDPGTAPEVDGEGADVDQSDVVEPGVDEEAVRQAVREVDEESG